MTQRFGFSIRAFLAVGLMAVSFFTGMAVTVVRTAGTKRELAIELGQAQERVKELESVVTVSADDLDSRKVVVIGRLGHPLETMLSVRGTWRRGRTPKDTGASFDVTHVNGKVLDEPIAFHHSLVRVIEKHEDPDKYLSPAIIGQSWEIRACETGGFSGNPAGYQMELTGLPYMEGTSSWWRHFHSELHGIR